MSTTLTAPPDTPLVSGPSVRPEPSVPTRVPAADLLFELEVQAEHDRSIDITRQRNLLARFQEMDVNVYPEYVVRRHKRREERVLKRQLTRKIGYTLLLLAVLLYELSSGSGGVLWFALGLVTLSLTGAILGRATAYWTTQELQSYRQRRDSPIPQAADDIVRRLSNQPKPITFVVESLKTDPLLWAHCEGVSFCVAAWKKPGRNEPLLGQE